MNQHACNCPWGQGLLLYPPLHKPHLCPHQAAENGGSLGSMFQRGQQHTAVMRARCRP